MGKNPLYTIQRITKDDKLYGPIHGAHNALGVLCGFALDESWYILTNNYEGEVTCKKCLRVLEGREKSDE
jgi:hypothetical protein